MESASPEKSIVWIFPDWRRGGFLNKNVDPLRKGEMNASWQSVNLLMGWGDTFHILPYLSFKIIS